jgi:hypothetical protein
LWLYRRQFPGKSRSHERQQPILTVFSHLQPRPKRSEAQMAINHIQNASFAAKLFGNIANAVRGWQAVASRAASSLEASVLRNLSSASGYWYALSLKRMPATATPISATCRTIISDRRHQRHQRWMSGVVVVVDPGTVGVS